MADIIFGFIEALFDGFITTTGRWSLSLIGWKANGFVEALLGLVVWAAVIFLSIALFGAIINS
jgi:hypothetical protein